MRPVSIDPAGDQAVHRSLARPEFEDFLTIPAYKLIA
jgi:hypothetical protein